MNINGSYLYFAAALMYYIPLHTVPSEYVRTPKQKAKHPTFSFVVEDLDIYKQQFKTILVEYANLFLEAIPIGEGACS